MPSIIFITNSFPKLSESFIYNKVCYLRDIGYDITVLVQTPSNEIDFFSKESINKIKIITTPPVNNIVVAAVVFLKYFILHPANIQNILKSFAGQSLVKRLKLAYRYLPFLSKKFDIVYFPFSGLGIPYMPLFSLIKKKSLIYISCRGSAEKIRPIIVSDRKKELEKLFNNVDRVHCVSEDMLETCMRMGLSPDKSFINRPAINPSLFNNIAKTGNNSNEDPIRLITVGRLHWVKYHDFLLLALKEYQEQGGRFCLSIVGSGSEYDRLLFLSYTLGLEKSINFLGPKSIEGVRQLLSENDIYIQTSVSEGISNSVMEAMAMSLPVICTNVGGMKELINDGVDGYLIPPFNNQIFVERLTELANDAILRTEIGMKARKKILNEFTLTKQCQIFNNEYNNQLQKNGR